MTEPKLLIVGDLLIDIFHEVDVRKISPEAPIPVASLTGKVFENPGGAGLAATYAAINDIPHLFSTVYDDNTARLLSKNSIEYLITNSDMSYNNNIIEKVRYIDKSTKYHILRVDNDDITERYLDRSSDRDSFYSNIEQCLKEFNVTGVLMLDYNKGIFDNSDFCQDIISLCGHRTTYVDSRSSNLYKFRGVDYLKLNDNESKIACSSFVCNDMYQLKETLESANLIVSHGKDGASIYSKDDLVFAEPNLDKYSGKPDVTGCGDILDVLFMSNLCLKDQNVALSLQKAVDGATDFAFKDVNERLCHSQFQKE